MLHHCLYIKYNYKKSKMSNKWLSSLGLQLCIWLANLLAKGLDGKIKLFGYRKDIKPLQDQDPVV